MTGRERVKAAMHYRAVDKAPLQYYYTPVGFYEHGEKLNALFAAYPGDFEPFCRQPIPAPGPEDFDGDGSYHAFIPDEWGTVWEKRIFGITGIPCKYPLEDIGKLDSYRPPAFRPAEGEELTELRRRIREKQKEYYVLMPGGSIFERMIQLRGDENVLCDLALDEPGIHALADTVAAYAAAHVRQAVEAGADGVSFGDDFGTERAMLLSPELWRRFFKPRYRALFAPAVRAGLDIHFHSCGWIAPILEDLREVGVTSIWPQLPLYRMGELTDRCRALGLAVAVHTDRANTMTYGTPEQVRELVKREFETFRMMEGGAWFYVEADNGFPFENLRALVETIGEWR